MKPSQRPSYPVYPTPIIRGEVAWDFALRFRKPTRHLLSDLFIDAVHYGAASPSGVVDIADKLARKRRGEASRRKNHRENAQFSTILRSLEENRSEALAYARSVLYWEALSPEEQAALKERVIQKRRDEPLATRPPSAGQLRLLGRLGFAGQVVTFQEASARITELKGQVTNKRAGPANSDR